MPGIASMSVGQRAYLLLKCLDPYGNLDLQSAQNNDLWTLCFGITAIVFGYLRGPATKGYY